MARLLKLRDHSWPFWGASGRSANDDDNPTAVTRAAITLRTHTGDHNGTTNLILDFTTYYFDLSAAAKTGKLASKREYSAKEGYGLNDLSPKSWNDLVRKMEAFVFCSLLILLYLKVTRMSKDLSLFRRYRDFFYRSGPASSSKCGRSCRLEMLCDLVTSEDGDRSNCDHLREAVYEGVNSLCWWFWCGEDDDDFFY